MHPQLRTCLVVAGAAGLSFLSPLSAAATQAVFRITDMDLRDPHTFVDFLGCRDFTDNALLGFSFNGQLQNLIEADSDVDGILDLSYLIVFDPLDQAGSGGTLRFGRGSCTAPAAGTACEPQFPLALASYPYVHVPATCLGILPNTTRPYSPAIVTPGVPCFVATLGTVTLELGLGVPMTLYDSYLAATYVGDPATGLVNGLMRGFLSEANADATLLPASYPLIGGQPMSALFPGGNGDCASHSDKDLGPGSMNGWYVYLNFTATPVPFNELPTAVGDGPAATLVLGAPRPNPFNPATAIRYTLSAAAPVSVGVFDARGRLVTRLVDEVQETGEHETTWNGRDTAGRPASSGVYFVRLASGGETRVRKIVLLK